MTAIYPGDKVTVDHPSCHDVALTMVGWHLDKGRLILQPPSGPSILVHPNDVALLRKPTPIGPPRPIARNTDPDTSHAAAKNTNTEADRALVLLTHADNPDGLTDFELAALHGRQQTSLGKRRGELRDLGLIARTDLKRPAPSGSMSIVWRITEQGRIEAAQFRKEPA